MRVIVCGGRHYENLLHVFSTLDRIHAGRCISLVIHGGATGADRLGARWAETNGVDTVVYHADWHAYEKAAGPMRNEKMLRDGRPDLVVAFQGSKGTRHMVHIARKANVEVIQEP